MWRRTVASFGSGSDLSFGLKIRYDLVGITAQEKKCKKSHLDAPQDRDNIEMQREKI